MHPVGAYSLVAGAKPVTVSVRPWSGDESHFLTHCTRCDACINACENNILQRGAGGYPSVNFKNNECSFCYACAQACPESLFSPRHTRAGICSSPLGTRAWRISQLNAAAVRIAVSQWQLSFARRSPGSTSRNLIANFATDVEHVQPAVRYQP